MSSDIECSQCLKEIEAGESYYSVVFNREALVNGSITVENSAQIRAWHAQCVPSLLEIEEGNPLLLLCDEPRD